MRIAVNINKANYSHHVIKQTGIMNVNCLSVEAPFSVFENFGFQSGRNTDKFANVETVRSDNGLVLLSKYVNAAMSLKVEEYVDLGSHGMFICSVTEARVISDKDTMTYTYYQNNVKPKPETEGKKGFVCKICGYVYEGDELPEDFICPLFSYLRHADPIEPAVIGAKLPDAVAYAVRRVFAVRPYRCDAVLDAADIGCARDALFIPGFSLPIGIREELRKGVFDCLRFFGHCIPGGHLSLRILLPNFLSCILISFRFAASEKVICHIEYIRRCG